MLITSFRASKTFLSIVSPWKIRDTTMGAISSSWICCSFFSSSNWALSCSFPPCWYALAHLLRICCGWSPFLFLWSWGNYRLMSHAISL